MKTRALTLAAATAVLLATLPCTGQEAATERALACDPEGTWYGSNSLGESYLFTFTKVGGGRYIAIAKGLTDTNFCNEATGWHGELVRTDVRTYWLRQILLCDASPAFPPGIWLWGSEGELVMTSCDHFETVNANNGAYAWGGGAVPFVDPFDIPFPDPVYLAYDRMPSP